MLDTESIKLEQQNNIIIHDVQTISWSLPPKKLQYNQRNPLTSIRIMNIKQLQNLVKLINSGSTNNKHYRNNILYL